MKLIKLKDDHYVVVDDSEIKEDCWALHMDPLGGKEIVTANGQCKLDKKITHSTQPVEPIVTENSFKSYEFIPLQEVKELIGEVDVEKRIYDTDFRGDVNSYKNGYNQALEDNKEKKYTEDDMRKAYMVGQHGGVTQTYYEFDDYIQSLQPKTEWEVEIVDGKLKLK